VAMFSADALSYIPYFDAYPNPSLTNNVNDITLGNYGLGSSGIINNSNWGIYASKLGLGQAIFESSGWSEMDGMPIPKTFHLRIRKVSHLSS
ncbi:hypothetical protein FWH09_02685, partial [Candidatus Saccharibacteria bacterium]|nr:hypothetical protein [Candidatus Saccharibacteria bacterium]